MCGRCCGLKLFVIGITNCLDMAGRVAYKKYYIVESKIAWKTLLSRWSFQETASIKNSQDLCTCSSYI